jgi:predicted Zn-dependent peptidase
VLGTRDSAQRTARVLAGLLSAALSVVFVGAQTGPDRTAPPAPGPLPVLTIPPIQPHVLSNGLPVWIVEMHDVPVIDVTVIVKAGGAADPAGRFGLAHYTAAMLDEGAGTRDALALADAIDSLGASLSTAATFDASMVRLHSLVATFDEALPLLADVVLRPTFAETDMDRLRTERLTTLLQIRDNVSQLASAAFSRMLYGGTHRYGTALIGTEAANRALTTAEVRRFHDTHYRPGRAHLLVVGDVSAAALLPKLEQAFGGWQGGQVPAATVPEAPVPAARQIYLIDKPGAAQSQIRVGTIGVARSTPDYFVLDVLNTVLGGSFTSRLNLNLREEHGYSYGAASGFAMRAAPGPFVAQAGVQADKTAESLVEFFKELDGMSAPVSSEELSKARNLLALGFPGSFETARQMAGQLADLVIYDLPRSLFEDYMPRIQAVNEADLQRAARQYLPTARFIVVIAGDLATIEGPVRAAQIGPVTVVAADDVLK